MEIGDKVRMDGERIRYTLQAINECFAIMTKPFAARKCYLYTIADRERNVRGRCDMIFGPPTKFDTPDGAAEALKMLTEGEMKVSYRRSNHTALTAAERTQLWPGATS